MPEATPLRSLCFVLMPFGTKPDGAGGTIDFDAVYAEIIEPAIVAARMEPIRADNETLTGLIHKQMFERLILCEYAVADLTTANANVFYELGVRHAIRPQTTVPIFSGQARLPFDVQGLRALPYSLVDGKPGDAASDITNLTERLDAARVGAPDSPVYQLVDDLTPADISRLRTDIFRDQIDQAALINRKLAAARKDGVAAVDAVREDLGEIETAEFGVAVDVFLSYRALSAWDQMIELADGLPDPLARSVMVQEQKALALNRLGKRDEAEAILVDMIQQRGPSSETYGILGRVYKDKWDESRQAGETLEARGHLKRAIDAYVKGFETDWRDAYPGVNAVTLMEYTDPVDPRQAVLIPVVRYSAQRRVAGGEPDYWDHATLLELAVLASDSDAAMTHAADAVAAIEEGWQPETTLRNLRLIRNEREARGDSVDWMEPIEGALASHAG